MKANLTEINLKEFNPQVFDLWDNVWFVLTCGDFIRGEFNAMTVGWGGFGIMWNKPMAMIVVRPTRFTYQFLNSFDTFSLCAFDDQFKPALQVLGSKSGRDCDKINLAGLSPIASNLIAAPVYRESDLNIECRKLYWEDLNPNHFLTSDINKNYPERDYHRLVIGEVFTIHGDASKYCI